MSQGSSHDDLRDAIALIHACLNGDVEAARIIHGNCNPIGVLAITTSIAAYGLIATAGEAKAHDWLSNIQQDTRQQAQ